MKRKTKSRQDKQNVVYSNPIISLIIIKRKWFICPNQKAEIVRLDERGRPNYMLLKKRNKKTFKYIDT